MASIGELDIDVDSDDEDSDGEDSGGEDSGGEDISGEDNGIEVIYSNEDSFSVDKEEEQCSYADANGDYGAMHPFGSDSEEDYEVRVCK